MQVPLYPTTFEATVTNIPQVWWTNNITEMNDPHFLLVIGYSKAKISVSKSVQAKLSALDPFAAAEWFSRYNNFIILHLFGYDISRKRAVRRGILGEGIAAAAANECTARGGLHAHMLVWLQELDLIRQLIQNPLFLRHVRENVSAFVDRFVVLAYGTKRTATSDRMILLTRLLPTTTSVALHAAGVQRFLIHDPRP